MSWQIYDFGASGTTLIDGANIYTGSILGTSIKANEITGNHIKAGAIATSHLAFSLVGSDNVVATINASTEGIKINAAKLTLTGLLQVGGAAADINASATTIDGGKITADSLDATKIKAASITTDKLAVGTVTRQNLITNGHFGSYNTFGDSAQGWTLASGVTTATTFSYTPKTSAGTDGSALGVIALTKAVVAGIDTVFTHQDVTVIPGRTYTVVGLLYAGNSQTSGTVYLRTLAMPSGTRLSSDTSGVSSGEIVPPFYQNATRIVSARDSYPVGIGWKLITYRVTIPNGCTRIRIEVGGSFGTTGTAVLYPTFIQAYDDDTIEATSSLDMVNQLQNVAFGGDLQGNYLTTTVRGIQGRLVSSTAPSNAQVLGWHASNNQWQPQTIAALLGYTPFNRGGDTLSGNSTLAAHWVVDVASERRIYASGTNIQWGLFFNSTGCGLFDWQNSRNILNYSAASNVVSSAAQISASQFNGSGAGLTGYAPALTAGAVAWTGITGKPTTLSGFGIVDAQPAATAITTGNIGVQFVAGAGYSYLSVIQDKRDMTITPEGYDWYRTQFQFTNTLGCGDGRWMSAMTMRGWSSGYAAWQIAGNAHHSSAEGWYLRQGVGTAWTDWREIVHSGNIAAQSVSSANTAGALAEGSQNPRASFATNVSNSLPSQAAIEIRELNRGGLQTGELSEAPSIGFHWQSRVYSHLLLRYDGILAHVDASRSTYNPFMASDVYATHAVNIYDSNTALTRGNGYALKITTPTGYCTVGPQDSSFMHFETDRAYYSFNKPVAVAGNLNYDGTNTAMTNVGFQTQAGNGNGYRFWDGAEGYSITMGNHNGAMGSGGYNTGGGDYSMCFRMDGYDANRGGTDNVARGFLFRNHSVGTSPYAQLAPLGGYSYWGGILIMRDTGNNNLYGIYFNNGVLYAKQMA